MVKKKKQETRIKKPLITAGISLTSVLIFMIFSSVFSFLGIGILSSLFSVLSIAATIFVFVGLYYLGKNQNNNFFKIIIIAGFVLYVLSFLFISFSLVAYESDFREINETMFNREATLEALKAENVSQEVIESYEMETVQYLLQNALPFLIAFLVLYFVFAVYFTFFGIGMIKMKKVQYSKVIGVLSIISAWLPITILGIFLAVPMYMVIYVLMILMFFQESKKAKE